MRRNWRQFEEWVTELKRDPFVRARLKLTILYLVVIVSIILFYLVLLNREFNRVSLTFATENITEKDRRQRFIARSAKIAQETLFSVQYEDVGMFLITIIVSIFLADKALKPIKKILVNQKQFLVDTSHELRTPLTIMRTEMEVFLRDKNSWINSKNTLSRKREAIISNIEEIEKMSFILEDLLTVARLGFEATMLTTGNINITRLLSHVVKRLHNSAKSKKIMLTFNEEKAYYIEGDSQKLEQTILNIVKNAIKFTPKKGKVTLKIDGNDTTVVITISDTGVGIDKKDLPYVFEQFYRGGYAFREKIPGSGLGLTISKSIIERHKGKITVQSTVGKGTIVSVFIPMVKIAKTS